MCKRVPRVSLYVYVCVCLHVRVYVRDWTGQYTPRIARVREPVKDQSWPKTETGGQHQSSGRWSLRGQEPGWKIQFRQTNKCKNKYFGHVDSESLLGAAEFRKSKTPGMQGRGEKILLSPLILPPESLSRISRWQQQTKPRNWCQTKQWS